LCVTGILLNLWASDFVTTEVEIQPINQSVVFLRERENFVTNDAWRVVLELNTSIYTEAILTIREDLRLAYEQRKEFTTLSELKQIQDLLNTLESRVGNLNQELPRMDSRRGLLDLSGNVLKSLFGVATIA